MTDQIFHNVEVSPHSIMQWSFFFIIFCINICVLTDQIFYNFKASLFRCIMQRSPASAICYIDICILTDQIFHNFEGAVFCRMVQRSTVTEICYIDICPLADQILYNFEVPTQCSMMQWHHFTDLIRTIDIRPLLMKELHDIDKGGIACCKNYLPLIPIGKTIFLHQLKSIQVCTGCSHFGIFDGRRA